MAAVIYTLCALTSFACAILLLRAYTQNRQRLLLWSGLCFTGLTVSNVILVLDRLVYPDADMSIARLVAALAGIALLLVGLILEGD